MTKIVISYRRQDSEAIAGRIRDRLVDHYGSESLFMDIDSIPYGVDFRAQIQQALRQTDILIAIIGPRWTGASRGRRARIQEENDPVRVEVERALGTGIPVIPVLVNGARMPRGTDLPDSLADLSYRNAAEVDAGRDFHQHVDRLIRSMDQILRDASTPTGSLGEVTDQGLPAPIDEGGTVAESKPAPAEPLEESPPQVVPAQPSRRWVTALVIAVVCGLSLGGAFVYRRSLYLKWPVVGPIKTAVDQPAPPPPPAAPIDTSCKPSGAVAFYDDFKHPDGGWGQSAATRFFKDGQMVLGPQLNDAESWIYYPLIFKSNVICTEIVSPSEIKNLEGEAAGGIIFWAVDYDNYYVAQLDTSGSYSIWRRVAGKWLSVAPRTRGGGLRAGPNAVNQLRIATGSTRATLFANGAKLIDFWGQPPSRGGAVGLFGQSEKDAASEWKFSSIEVVESKPDTAPSSQALYTARTAPFLDACKQNGATIFFDEFAPPDPGWGTPGDTGFFKDGRMVLKPAAKSTTTWTFSPMVFKSGVVCSDIKTPVHVKNLGGDSNGGIMFWASDDSNYYLAAIYADGTFGVYREIDGIWATLLPRSKAASIQPGENAVNRVKITFANDTATLTVNGSDIFHMQHAQPPDGGGAVGFYAGSEDDDENQWNFLNIAVMENNSPPASPQTNPPPPTACKSSSPVAFFDNFSPPDPGWGAAGSTYFFEDGEMVLKPKASSVEPWIYQPMVFGNATGCSQIQSPHQLDNSQDNSRGGLIFWAKDYDNYYVSEIFTDGTYSLWRRAAGKWIAVVPRAKESSIRSGPDAINQMTIRTAANVATLLVNDTKLVDVWGQPPRKGGAVGLFAESDASHEDSWRFSKIAVIEDKQQEQSYPAAAQVASDACKKASSPAFFDNFAAPDPGWGAAGSTYFFKDGQMVLKPKTSSFEFWTFDPLIFRDATICSEFKFPSQPQPSGSTGASGIMFWAVDYKNYYVAAINLDGSYSVYRKIDDEWATVIPRTVADAIHQGPNAVNRMKVILEGGVASIVINDTTVTGFHGQPAKVTGAVGLYAQSGDGSESEWRFTNIVVTN